MPEKKSFFRVFTETGPLVALAVAIMLLVGIVGPASAQFFNFPNFGGPPRPPPRSGGYGGGGGWFGGETREALRGFQASIGAPADGFASSDVLERLRSR